MHITSIILLAPISLATYLNLWLPYNYYVTNNLGKYNNLLYLLPRNNYSRIVH